LLTTGLRKTYRLARCAREAWLLSLRVRWTNRTRIVKPQTVYLDVSILSRIPDLRVTEGTANALQAISRSGHYKFVTSQKSLQEILRTENAKRNAMLQFLFMLLEQVEFHTVYYSGCIGGAPIGATPIGGDGEDSLFTGLKGYFEPDDADHIVQAIRGKCDFFLTLDQKTILDRVVTHHEEISKLCGTLAFVSPEQLCARMEAAH
jgi:predicted nucleic acid-binding protein